MSVKPYKNKQGEVVPHAWLINCYPAGRKGKEIKKVVRDCTEAQAKQLELALIRQHVHKIVPHDPLVRDVVPEWLQAYALDHAMSTVGDIERAMLRLLPHFGTWHLSRLTLPLFEDYMRKRQKDTWRPPIQNPDPDKVYMSPKPVGKGRINTELKYMGMLIKYAVGKKYMLKPPFDIPQFRKLKKTSPALPTVNEVDNLLPNLHPDAYLAVLLYHDAGLRRTEALTLRTDDVYLEEEILRVIGKGNKQRTVPIVTDRLKEGLARRLQEIEEGYPYHRQLKNKGSEERRKKARINHSKSAYMILNPQTGQPYKDLRKTIENAAEKAGINKNIYNHLFRHTHATLSLEAGVDLVSVQENLGHADIGTTRGYLQARLGHRLKESQKLKAFLQKDKKRKGDDTDNGEA